MPGPEAARIHERYALCAELASGGMATVHIGRLLGPVGFSRTVAIKRLRPQYANSSEFRKMFVDEARLAARVRHPNVVQTLDVVARDHELFVVMDYVHGESLSRLLKASIERELPSPRIVATIIGAVLHGLQAAHDATSEKGKPLGIIHRDVSPQNIIVGADGIARVLDFGVAKAAGRLQTTQEGNLKGKLAYMAPEQIEGAPTQSTDIYATSVVLWEALTGKRLFGGNGQAEIVNRILHGTIDPPSKLRPSLPAPLDDIIMKGLARKLEDRFGSAREMALALERCLGVAPSSEVGGWVVEVRGDELLERARLVARIEESSAVPSDRFAISVAKYADTMRDKKPPVMDEGPPVEARRRAPVEKPPRREEPARAVASAVSAGGVHRSGWLAVAGGLSALVVSTTILLLWRAGSTSEAAASSAYGLVSSAQGPVPVEAPPPNPAETGGDLGAAALAPPRGAAGRSEHGAFGVITAPDTWDYVPSPSCDPSRTAAGADGGLGRACPRPARSVAPSDSARTKGSDAK